MLHLQSGVTYFLFYVFAFLMYLVCVVCVVTSDGGLICLHCLVTGVCASGGP